MNTQKPFPITPSSKNEVKKTILKQYKAPKKTQAIILLKIDNPQIYNFLKEWFEAIDVLVIDVLEDSLLAGIDAVISTENIPTKTMESFLQKGIAPIISVNNSYGKKFTHFDPMKFSGNAFLFSTINAYEIFAQACRFLENIRYSGDRRTLIKNLQSTTLTK